MKSDGTMDMLWAEQKCTIWSILATHPQTMSTGAWRSWIPMDQVGGSPARYKVRLGNTSTPGGARAPTVPRDYHFSVLELTSNTERRHAQSVRTSLISSPTWVTTEFPERTKPSSPILVRMGSESLNFSKPRGDMGGVQATQRHLNPITWNNDHISISLCHAYE